MSITGSFVDTALATGLGSFTATVPAKKIHPWPVPGALCDLTLTDVFFLELQREQDRCAYIDVLESNLLLLAPLTGSALRITGQDGFYGVPAGQAIIVVRDGRLTLRQADPGVVAIIQIERGRFQSWVGATYQEPRRLRQAAVLIELDDVQISGLLRMPGCRSAQAGRAAQVSQDEFCQRLITLLSAADAADDIWQTSKTLKRATDYIFANLAGDCSPAKIADAAGMTLKTLQRQMRAYLGSSLSAFVRDARLTAAQTRLETAWESRPIDVMAVEYGFKSATVFTRAYRRRYGVTPSAARARAVREAA